MLVGLRQFISLGSRVSLGGDGGDSPDSSDGAVQPTSKFACGIKSHVLAINKLARPFHGATAGDEPGRADALQHLGREVKAAPDHNVTCLGIIADQARADLLLACLRSGKGQGVVE